VRDLERDLHEWQAALDRIGEERIDVAAALPARVRAAIDEPGAGGLVWPGQRPRVWPQRQILYQMAFQVATELSPLDQPSDRALIEAESDELRAKDYSRAIVLYDHALAVAARDRRAPILHRLARTLRKAGRDEEALARYRELAASSDRIGVVPADLIAQYEIGSLLAAKGDHEGLESAAFVLYRGLVDGRWVLEKPRYLFYSAAAREWLTSNGAPMAPMNEIDRWTAVEDQKQLLTDAIAGVLDTTGPSGQSSDGRFLTLRTSGTRGVVFVVANTWLSTYVWPDTFKDAIAEGFDVALLGPTGDFLFGPPRDSRHDLEAAISPVTRAAHDPAIPWRVRVSAHDPGALTADLARRQTLYLVMLLLVVVLLAFGTYLTMRVVRRELEIARLKSDFVSTVSHEFRSPLTGIRQLAELLMRGRVPSEERRQEYYERITREGDRLSRLVENLLDFSRMEDGRREYRFEPLDPSPWLHGLADEARSQLADGHVAIVATIPDTLPPLLADHAALSSAVHNLIDNAVKYSPGCDTVWLDADARNGHVTIRVRDLGVGISEDDRQHMFEKFYRGHSDITRQVQGAGLGLSLVDHIVRAHGGQVECESRPGDGTTFAIVLPRVAARGRESTIEAEGQRQFGGRVGVGPHAK
jgi:signal transduction histidine kinase